VLISLIHVPRTTATYTEQNWDQRSALGPGSDMGRSVERVGHRVCIIFPLLGSEQKPQSAVAMGTSPLFFITARFLLVITRLLRRRVPCGGCLYYFTLQNFVITINSKKQQQINKQIIPSRYAYIYRLPPH